MYQGRLGKELVKREEIYGGKFMAESVFLRMYKNKKILVDELSSFFFPLMYSIISFWFGITICSIFSVLSFICYTLFHPWKTKNIFNFLTLVVNLMFVKIG